MRTRTIYILVLALFSIGLKAQTIIPLQQGPATSIRGLSVVNNKIAWVSGSKGTIAITTDGGKNWSWQKVKGFEEAEFRDIEAFSDKEAVIIASGSPAYILKTVDGGANWAVKYQKTDSAYFLDAMGFANKNHGFVLGDPIGDKFLLLETTDGGETWKPCANPPIALKGEASFAASGTCLRVTDMITIVTGGANSRLLTSPLEDMAWIDKPLPLTNGAASRGAFSVAYGKDQTVIVGGNYEKDKQTDSVAYLIPQREIPFKNNIPAIGPAGFQSCVEYISGNTFLSTGTPGSNLTTDGGKTWRKIDSVSYNVCIKARKGNLVLLAGNDGKIGILKF